jgi:hypothetical protein
MHLAMGALRRLADFVQIADQEQSGNEPARCSISAAILFLPLLPSKRPVGITDCTFELPVCTSTAGRPNGQSRAWLQPQRAHPHRLRRALSGERLNLEERPVFFWTATEMLL